MTSFQRRVAARTEHELIATFGDAQLVRDVSGKLELKGGSALAVSKHFLRAEGHGLLLKRPTPRSPTCPQFNQHNPRRELATHMTKGGQHGYLRSVRAADRATEFRQRCDGLGISGVSLHSYRYAWAERAKQCGYLYDAQLGASRRIREMGAEMFGYPVSEATLQAARQEQYQALESFENRLAQILLQEPILHADETSVPINKIKHWLHVLCTPLLTFFAIHLNRGKEAIEAIGIVPRFTGWLMHDFLSSYLSFENCMHTFCKSHLLRELVFLFEQHQQRWAKALYDLFLKMLQCVKDRKARDAPLTEKQYALWRRQYRNILRAGRRANPRTPAQRANPRSKQSKAQNLLDRLEGYDDCILAFLWALELPFTNNEAERAFRMMKVRLKISGCFRTLEGARRHARIRSYISTLRKHRLPVLHYLRLALDGRPFLPQPSKTT